MNPAAPSTAGPHRVSASVKRILFLYLCGVTISLQATSLIEWMVDLSAVWQVKAPIVLLAGPLAVAFLGYLLFPPSRHDVPPLVWSLNAVVMTVFWGGGYVLAGVLTYGGDFMSLEIPLDRQIPFTPEWIFVYLTVYFVFLMPLFYLEDRRRLVTLDLAQVLSLAFSYTMFLYCPVAIDRPTVEPLDFATWTVAVVQGNDPAWNCFPSTHCVACTVAALAMLESNWKAGYWILLSTVAICISTVMTKQHFVLDAAAGVLLGVSFFFLAKVIVATAGDRLGRLLGPDWGAKQNA
jgi:membrane-associated phospholipid phosphatase